MSGDETLNLEVEFCGGAELLFNKVKHHNLTLPASKADTWTIRKLLTWLRDNALSERPELFLQDDSVRPGILVLVNDTDWELCDQLEYCIQPGDKITFISTLHGG